MPFFSAGVYKDVDAIIGKLKKLQWKYRDVKTSCKKSGISRPLKGWKFLEKTDNIYKHSPSINPQFVLDTSKEDQNLESPDDEPDSQSGKEREADVVRLAGASGKFMCCINFVSAGSLWPMENLESNENQLSNDPCEYLAHHY